MFHVIIINGQEKMDIYKYTNKLITPDQLDIIHIVYNNNILQTQKFSQII